MMLQLSGSSDVLDLIGSTRGGGDTKQYIYKVNTNRKKILILLE
jgi:hypothetical protein